MVTTFSSRCFQRTKAIKYDYPVRKRNYVIQFKITTISEEFAWLLHVQISILSH